jgi:tetratricopeptide (TPR) repeat protein
MKRRLVIAGLTASVFTLGYTTGRWVESTRPVPPPPAPLMAEFSAKRTPAPARPPLNRAQLAAEIDRLRPQIESYRKRIEALEAAFDRALAGMTESSPALLDTRGFILHLLGRHREAVDQLNVAINGLQQTRRQLNNLRGRVDDPVLLACRMRRLEHEWAVMLHHRALACRAIGLEEQAKQDFDLAARKGFDPARGIF